MTAAEFSLLAVTVSFLGLVAWVYWPSRRSRIESYASVPLEDDDHEVSGGHGREERT
jgi:cbb3-type cytochrome oxidase subunit 3